MRLGITSPLTHGEAVKKAQRALKKNKFNQNFMGSAKLDGVYGPATASAVARAKYWLGYRSSKINKQYDSTLDRWLKTGKLSAICWIRRRRRLALAKSSQTAATKRAKILRMAQSQIGVKESPAGSNKVKYSDWYGMRGPWCAMFVSWCFAKNGWKSKFHYAYCPFIVADAKSNRNRLYVVNNPAPGDLVLYDWENDGVANHIGIYEKKTGSGTFTAIEGNTAVGNNSNGGQVMRRNRKTSDVICFVRVRM